MNRFPLTANCGQGQRGGRRPHVLRHWSPSAAVSSAAPALCGCGPSSSSLDDASEKFMEGVLVGFAEGGKKGLLDAARKKNVEQAIAAKKAIKKTFSFSSFVVFSFSPLEISQRQMS